MTSVRSLFTRAVAALMLGACVLLTPARAQTPPTSTLAPPASAYSSAVAYEWFYLVSQLLHQQPKGSDKIYALHEPEVDCISKGKARVRYEFGCKVSIATTVDEGFVVGMRSFAGNPYDGHTLRPALEQVEVLTDQRPDLAVVDRGYRGHGEGKTRVLISGTRRGLTAKLIADLRRRSAIEAEIGHMKTDGRLSRCPLKGSIGDALFAVLCACGHNIRKILAHLRDWLAWIIAAVLNAAYSPGRQYQPVTSA
jgi:IS5 family transposase